MTSVPYLNGEAIRSGHTARFNADQAVSEYYRSSLPSKLLEIRHIKSIIIRRIGSESSHMYRTQNILFESKKSRKLLKSDSSETLEESPNNGLPELPTNEDILGKKVVRKGKSSYDLNKQYNPESLSVDKIRTLNTAKDDNFLSKQAPVLDLSLFEPVEIRRQHEFQAINEDTFFDCFYTINNFLNIDKPYFISRIFPYYAEIADELELHVFSKSATINLYIRDSSNKWKLSKQYHTKLSLLVNLGDDLEIIEKKLRYINNILLLKLADDCYYILPNESVPHDIIRTLKANYLERVVDKFDNFQYKETSCSYDQIMTMNNFSRCIHDLLYTKQTLENRISDELKKEDSLHKILDTQNTIQTSNEHLNEVLNTKLAHNYQIELRIAQLKNKKEKLKARILQLKYPPTIKNADTSVRLATDTSEVQEENIKLITQINLEKARIASVIQFIFPMKAVEAKHDFSLFQTCFPSSLIPHTKGLDDSEHSTIIPISIVSSTIIQRLTQISRPHSERLNSLLGYISLIVLTVADMFNISLRYPIRELGSNSYINDLISDFNTSTPVSKFNRSNNISVAKSTTIYPLFICQNATLAVKFTYALLLLRKDLEQLYEVEGIVKIEEFNLLIACKIWLTCVEGYADAVINGNSDLDVDYVEEDIETITDNNFLGSNSTQEITPEPRDIPENEEVLPDTTNKGNKLSSLLSDVLEPNDGTRRISASSRYSKMSNPSILSGLSRDSAVSGISAISAASNASSIVNEYNQKLHSEERIKHIKKHLLKGSGGKL